jgi:hypothetical protein
MGWRIGRIFFIGVFDQDNYFHTSAHLYVIVKILSETLALNGLVIYKIHMPSFRR